MSLVGSSSLRTTHLYTDSGPCSWCPTRTGLRDRNPGPGCLAMATKVIYFTYNGVLDKAEFSSLDTATEVKDLFRSATEAAPCDILKLYNDRDTLINISQLLESNTPDRPYRLQVIATSTDSLMKEVGVDVCAMEKRIEDLENNIIVNSGKVPDSLKHVNDEIESLNHKLESIEHLSWIGLSRDLNGAQTYSASRGNGKPTGLTSNNNWEKNVHMTSSTGQTEVMDRETVFDKFHRMRDMELNSEVKGLLEDVNFNNWQWNEPEMLVLLQQMYIDLGLLASFNIPKSTFHSWLCEVYTSYNRVPFHNFKHCFMVSQMMYGLIVQLNLKSVFSQEELFSLLTSAVCHDLDHPGYNNTYQVNARTELAVRYNDVSPLENHHCSVAFKILAQEEFNILKNVSEETFRRIRQNMIRCILATDMAKHNDILHAFKNILAEFDLGNTDHRHQLMMVLIKCADISNECRPMEVAEPWIDCLLEEFFNQSDLEKKSGLPVAPYMDREKVNKNSSQVQFIKYVLLPLFDSLAVLYPKVQDFILSPLQDALQYYQKLSATVTPSTSSVKPALPTKSTSSVKSATSRAANNLQAIVNPQTNGTM